MWVYEKRLQYPVRIKCVNTGLANALASAVGGPDGEVGAAMRYLFQRYTMPIREAMAVLTDIGTEELAHAEILDTMIHQLSNIRDADDIRSDGFRGHYIDHTLGRFPETVGGVPFMATFQSKGDPIADLYEDMAAEQKARVGYDNLLRITDDPDVKDALRFLRSREIAHFQRFGETLRLVQEKLDCKNFYAYNPSFDRSARNAYNGNTGERIENYPPDDSVDSDLDIEEQLRKAVRSGRACPINEPCECPLDADYSDVDCDSELLTAEYRDGARTDGCCAQNTRSTRRNRDCDCD